MGFAFCCTPLPLRIQGDGVWCLLLTSCHDYFLSSLIGSRKSFQVNFSVQKCTYQCTFWYQIQRGEKQTRGKGTCVYRLLAIARVCTPAGPQTALGYDPWSTEGYESLSGEAKIHHQLHGRTVFLRQCKPIRYKVPDGLPVTEVMGARADTDEGRWSHMKEVND